MEKGKFGIRVAFYAVAAFVLVLFGSLTGLLLLAGVTIFVEKDEWASRQVIQAIGLLSLSYLVAACFDVLAFFDWMSWSSSTIIYGIYRGWSRFQSVVNYCVQIAVYVFAFISILKVSKGKEADVPCLSKLADWAYGKVVVKPQPVYQAPVQPQQPVQPQPVYQAPVQPQQPVQPAQPVQTPVQPAQPVQPQAPAADVCSNCGNPLNGAAFCTKCGTPANKQ